MNKNIDLSIIIVSYNGKTFLHDTIYSVINTISKKTSYEVIVVDNDSTDGSADMVKKTFPQVTLIQSANEGFGKGNNKGVKVSHGRYVLFLNPDTVVYPDVIEKMMVFMDEHKDTGASTCKLVMKNGQMDYACHRGFPTPWRSLCYFSGLIKLFPHSKLTSGYTLGWEDLAKTHEIEALAGAFMLTRREAGEQVGWWDEEYFFNGEDLDFCYNLRKKGWKIYYVPEYEILHYNGVSGGTKPGTAQITTASKETKRFIQKHRFDAMRIFYQKHYVAQYPWIVTWLVLRGIAVKEWLVIRKYS